jgi:hypothetical protein
MRTGGGEAAEMQIGKAFRLIDTGQAQEIFCSGLGRVEHLGSVVRFTLYSESIAYGEPEGVVNIKIILPAEAVGPAIELTLATLGTRVVGAVTKFISERLFH